MIDRQDIAPATLATLLGWCGSHAAAFLLAAPSWLRSFGQLLFTVLCGLATVTAQHYWREFFLNRRRQDKAKAKD